MRKILEKKDEKKLRRERLIWSIFIITILMLSVAGYLMNSYLQETTEETVIYEGREFKRSQYGTWQFIYANNIYETRYTPLDVSNVSLEITKKLSDYQGKVLYFVNPNQEAMNEILINIGSSTQRQAVACLNEEDCDGDFPIKSCENDEIIVFVEGNISMITQEQKCIYIESSIGNYSKAADAFVFELLGI